MRDLDPEAFAAEERPKWDAVAPSWKKWWWAFEAGAQGVNDHLVELAAVRPGHAVLDIATGLGEPALTAARVAGDGGRVRGFDLSPEMVHLASERARADGVGHADFAVQNAEQLDVAGASFDAAVCRWGLMLMGDPVAAARRVFDALRPGGRFAAAVWSEPARVRFLATAGRVVRAHLDQPDPEPDQPGPFRLAHPEALPDVLRAAGFAAVGASTATATLEFGSADEWVSFVCEMSHSTGRLLNEAPDDVRQRAQDALREAALEFALGDGRVRFDNVALCAVGERP